MRRVDHDADFFQRGLVAQRQRQGTHRQRTALVFQHRSAADAGEIIRQLDHALDDRHRQRQLRARGRHQHGRHDRQLDRQADRKAGALAQRGFDADCAAVLLDRGFHHVHAHAAARDRGSDFLGREARQEHQLIGVFVALGAVVADQALVDRLLAQLDRVHALAVVLQHDHDAVGLLPGLEQDEGLGRLAGGDPLLGRFDAVVEGVAQHVHQRIVQAVHHHAVDFGLGAFDGQLDVLAQVFGQLAHQAREFLEQAAHRLHAGCERRALQLGRVARGALQGLAQGRDQHRGLAFELELLQALEQHRGLVGGLHRFAGHFEQRIELDGVDTDAFVLGRGDDGILAVGTAFDAVPVLAAGSCRRCGRGCWRGSRHARGHRGVRCDGDHRGRGAGDRIRGRHHGVVHAGPVETIGIDRSRGSNRRRRLDRHRSGRRDSGRCGSRRSVLALDRIHQDAFEVARHLRQAFRRRAVVEVTQLVGHEAGRLQRRLDRERRHRRGAGAQRVEQVLGQVAGRDQRWQAHEAGAALDRVERPEHRVQGFLVIGVAFEAQQVFFYVDRQIHRLDDEILQHIVH